ncbi:MAG: insulinase family protein [Gammaproteobacteria bacterium]|nr:insulinase family protein [Gammaproteobacteria bacterium]
MKKLLLLFLTSILFNTATAASTTDLQQYSFKNGLKLIVKVDHRAPVAIFQVWYRVGGSYESSGITGISHLTEHMMFDGTAKHPAGELTRILTINGASFNAFTDRDYTAYYEEISTDKLPLAFELESDRMQNLSLTQAQFDKEIKVVKEERRLRTDDQPSQIALERFMAAAYVSSPYHHPVVGWMDDLNHMTVAKVRSWYHDWYGPNNATIVIVGDVDPAAMQQLTEKYFGAIAARSLPSVPATAEVASLGRRDVLVKIPAKVPLLFMGYNVPSLLTADNKQQAYALAMLAAILAGDQNSRFQHDLVRGQEIAGSAEADYDPFSRLSNLFLIAGTPSHMEDMSKLQSAFEKQIKAVQKTLVTEKELQRIKAQVIAEKTYGYDSIVDQATQIGAINGVGLPLTTIDDYVANIDAVTAEQVRAVAQQYLTDDNLTITILKPLPMSEQQQEQLNDGVSMSSSVH